jgi:hypothetical protein
MKVLFLDWDGVVKLGKPSPEDSCLKRLRNIIDKTNALIVMSSSHRLYPSHFKRRKEELRDYGLFVYDTTPDFSDADDYTRDDEIKAWLNLHPQVTKFAILDDLDLEVSDNFFQTEFNTGLTNEIMRKIISHLNEGV